MTFPVPPLNVGPFFLVSLDVARWFIAKDAHLGFPFIIDPGPKHAAAVEIHKDFRSSLNHSAMGIMYDHILDTDDAAFSLSCAAPSVARTLL